MVIVPSWSKLVVNSTYKITSKNLNFKANLDKANFGLKYVKNTLALRFASRDQWLGGHSDVDDDD